MDIEPPIRYPPRIIIHDSDNETESSFRASDDTTIAESENISPSIRQPPAYGDEGAPPRYQEGFNSEEDVKARRKVKKTLCIRLMTSIFITVLVSLIVAAVVARIHDSQINTDWSSNQTVTDHDHTSNGTSFTMSLREKSTPTQPVMTATANLLQHMKTEVVAEEAEPTATFEASASTTVANEVRTVDCASPDLLADASLITDTTPAATGKPTSKRLRSSQQPAKHEDDEMIGMSIYTLKGCLLARSTYKGSGIGDLVHKCTMMCPDKKLETNQARHVVTDEWGACG